jgi:hypothetical protein
MNIRPRHEWDRFEGLSQDPQQLQSFLDNVPFAGGGERRLRAALSPATGNFSSSSQRRAKPFGSCAEAVQTENSLWKGTKFVGRVAPIASSPLCITHRHSDADCAKSPLIRAFFQK